MATNEFREYENGVADILASIVGDAAIVERNVRLPSKSRVRPRQIDVFVSGTVFNMPDTCLVVDCKCWKTAVDATQVEAFVGLVDDVGANMGLLVSAAGASEGAVNRAQSLRGIRVKPLSVTELARWRPQGTVSDVIELPLADLERAAKSLREAGFRVHLREDEPAAPQQVRIDIFRHYGITNPSADIQRRQLDQVDAVFAKLGVPHRLVSHGFSITGGTPRHRWTDVRLPGGRILKVSAATEAELEDNLLRMAQGFHIPRSLLTVDRPEDWPVPAGFPF